MLPVELTPERWLAQLFSAKAVGKAGVLRRSAGDIDRLVGRDAFLAGVEKRGFRAVENNGQIVIFCNRAPVRVLV